MFTVAIEIPQLNFSVYSLSLFIGSIIAIIFLLKYYYVEQLRGKKYLIKHFIILSTLLPSVIIFVGGAFLFDNFFHYLNGEEFGSSGISFLGGATPLLLCYLIALFFKPQNKFINTALLVLPMMHSLGRIGCLFGGCCYGIPCDFGIYYHEEATSSLVHGYQTPLFPTQILESIVCLIIFILLLVKFKENRFFYYTIIYGVYRFFAEFLRGDNRGSTLTFLSPSQLLSIILIIMGAIYYFKFIKNKKTV